MTVAGGILKELRRQDSKLAGGQALEPWTPASHHGSDIQGLVETERGTLLTSKRTLSSGPRSFLTVRIAFESLDLDLFVCQTRPGLGERLAGGLSQIPLAEMTPGDSPPPAEVLSEGFSGNVLYTLQSAVHTQRVHSLTQVHTNALR